MEPKETYKVGETITYRVSLKNTKADSEAINSVSKDALDGRLNYLPGSLKIIISGPNSGEKRMLQAMIKLNMMKPINKL